MEIGKTFCGRTDGRTDGRTHLSSNLLGHRRGDDLKIEVTNTTAGDKNGVLIGNNSMTVNAFKELTNR